MEQRADYVKLAGAGMQSLYGVLRYLEKSSLPARLRYLVELRVSQINGCAFCCDRHAEEARHAGELQQRLDVLPGWREAPFFTAAERAALAWAESLTLMATRPLPDHEYAELQRHYSEQEIVDLSLAVANMNAFNRLAVGFVRRIPPRQENS